MAAAQLTDEELVAELKRLGFTPGPVTESTRPVYLKKLKKLREEQQQRRTRSNKARYSSGSINNNSGSSTTSTTTTTTTTSRSNTAARASAFGTRPVGDDVTHLERHGRESGGGGTYCASPPSQRAASVGTGKFVLGFSSDESDVEVNLKKDSNHSRGGRDRRECGRQPQQPLLLRLRSGPEETPQVGRRSSGAELSGGAGNFSSPQLLDARHAAAAAAGSGLAWWDERVRRASGSPGRSSFGENEELEAAAAHRTRWGLSCSHGVSGSLGSAVIPPPVDYSDSDEEGVPSPKDAHRERRPPLRRSLPKTAPLSHENAARVGILRAGTSGVDDPVTRRTGGDVAAGATECEDGVPGCRRAMSPSDGLRNRSSPVRPGISSHAVDVEGTSSGSSVHSNNHIHGEGPGARSRYSAFGSLSSRYLSGNSGNAERGRVSGATALKQKLAAPEDELLQQFKREEEASATGGFSAHYLSMVLLTTACLFFILLGLMYLRMRGSGVSESHATIKSHPFGIDFDTSHTDKERDTILGVLHHLHNHLAKIAGEHDCGDYSQHSNRSLSLSEVSEFLMLRGTDYMDFVSIALDWIIRAGEDVGIRLIGNDSEIPVTDVSQVTRLESTHPRMSFICRFRRALFTVIHRVLLLLAGVGVVWGVLYYMKYRWKKEEVETRQMYDMVERIIDVLRSHSEACQESPDLQPYLPIPHVRDSLIQPQDRKRMKKVWDRAVAFLSANESRIRTETQRIGGADFLVWRWIQPALTCNKISSTPSKVWQGKAFPLDRRNSPPNSLTPCLKIRNMFDPVMEVGENWDLAIHEAILEKCSDNDGIVHIAVDKSSREGCVYVKCLTAEHAGKAFKALHGSWFDGKLVTVKYLRLDRYHQRFPQALGCSTPLKPSSKHMSTLSHLRLQPKSDSHLSFS
ncbi:inner nuclear membrane protein Man1-like [Scleropages formosus]|uniref:Inner nuclear membrane protein Man1 n=1 Tax=Scleropages formosus TaxID=113540 RepID=A0A8C9SM71_SCLFO|nr:inner nuclear membrane protein Man1-like [Scleropages formosus]